MKFLSLLFILTLSACATTSATITQTVYPEFEIKKTDAIVVKNFNGVGGEQVARSIEKVLITKGFRVLDRKNLDEDILSKSGKIQPASFIITGEISLNAYEPEPPRYSEITCYEASGRKFDTQSISNKVNAILAGDVRIIRVMDNKVLAVKNISQSTSSRGSTNCGHPIYPEPRESLFDELKKDFAHETSRLFTPYNKDVNVTLYNVDKKLLPEVNQGHELFKQDKLAEALNLYKMAVNKLEKGSYSNEIKGHVFYAYGITLGYLHKEGALENIKIAYGFNPEIKYIHEMTNLKRFYKKSETRNII